MAVLGVFSGVPAWQFWFPDPRFGLFPRIYLPTLGGSYLLTWLAANVHLLRGRRLARTLGEATADLGEFRAGRRRRWEWGVRPVPILAAIVLTFAGLAWSLPMLLAATAQRRVGLVHDRRLRGELGGRLRRHLDRRRPSRELPPVVDRETPCTNDKCAGRVPFDATFCPRCGAAQRPKRAVLLE